MRWHVGILALILCVFSGVLYATTSTSLNRDLNKSLALQAAGTADALFAFWRAERATLRGPGNWEAAPADTFLGAVNAGELPGLVSRWAEKTDGLNAADRSLRVLDRSGRVMGASETLLQTDSPLTSPALAGARQGHAAHETFRVPGGRVRLISHPVTQGGSVLYVVQAAASLEHVDRSLKRLLFWLLWLVPLTLVLTSSVGWFLASRALYPIGLMITDVQRIRAERLDQRVNVPQTGDELEQLAVTFNAMLARFEEGFKRLRQFSAAASHELRTPLTAMRGELEVALRKPRDPEEYRRVLQTHLETINDMAKTVEELLMLARHEAVEGALEWRPLDLGELAQHAAQTWRTFADAKAVRLEVRTNGSAWVRGERRLLERVVANLLDNALRHTPAAGCVTVRAEPRDHEACLIVQDTGPGIPPGELPHIFERFFKPRSTRDGDHSTGLGLGLCRWIAEAHHGRIDVASQAGAGTTFTVTLPRLTPPV